jgi:hypothetical protein
MTAAPVGGLRPLAVVSGDPDAFVADFGHCRRRLVAVAGVVMMVWPSPRASGSRPAMSSAVRRSRNNCLREERDVL